MTPSQVPNPRTGPADAGKLPPIVATGYVEMLAELGNASDAAFDAPVFVISVAAQMAGMHPQTLRQYDRLGLVQPGRTAGGGRRYSARDVVLLREVARLSQDDGVNLAGIKRIMELERAVVTLQEQVEQLGSALHQAKAQLHHLNRGALVVWRPEA